MKGELVQSALVEIACASRRCAMSDEPVFRASSLFQWRAGRHARSCRSWVPSMVARSPRATTRTLHSHARPSAAAAQRRGLHRDRGRLVGFVRSRPFLAAVLLLALVLFLLRAAPRRRRCKRAHLFHRGLACEARRAGELRGNGDTRSSGGCRTGGFGPGVRHRRR